MKDIYQFLEKIKSNNNREWFADNKEEYEIARAEASSFFEKVAERLFALDDFSKYRMYRIYRDVRFSKDKTPFKTHFAAIFSRRQPHNRGSFYLQISPGNSMIGGGFWNPEKDDLLRIRKGIEMEDDLAVILANDKLKRILGEMEGERLKTSPKGFDAQHPRIELLRYKQFLLRRSLTDEEVFGEDLIEKIAETYQVMRPFFAYMTEVLTTDENGESLF